MVLRRSKATIAATTVMLACVLLIPASRADATVVASDCLPNILCANVDRDNGVIRANAYTKQSIRILELCVGIPANQASWTCKFFTGTATGPASYRISVNLGNQFTLRKGITYGTQWRVLGWPRTRVLSFTR